LGSVTFRLIWLSYVRLSFDIRNFMVNIYFQEGVIE